MRISLSEVTFGEDEIAEALDCLKSGRVTMGQRCRDFERAFADYVGVRHAVFVNSGSSANLLAWFALANPQFQPAERRRPFAPGAEVIVPAVAWATTIWPIVQAGGVPVLVDCDPATLQIIPEAVERAVGPATVALCPVHALGNVCDMDALLPLCERHSLTLVEDTCESLGSRHGGRLAGSFGLMGTYSFYFSHHMTTIEGGMVVTDDDRLADLLRCLRAHGWTRDTSAPPAPGDFSARFRFVNTGFNLRPTEINAAFGLHQLRRLEGFNQGRRDAVRRLNHALARFVADGRLAPMRTDAKVDAAYFGYPVLCRSESERNALAAHLESSGVETRPIICGNMARQPAMAHVRHRISGSLAGADRIMDHGLYWGMHPLFGQEHVDFVASAVARFFEP